MTVRRPLAGWSPRTKISGVQTLVTPFRVGLLVLASGAALFAFLSFARKGALKGEDALTAYAYFRDASGLSRKSRVQIAGIPVGEITGVALEGARAKVTLKLRREVGIKRDATLTKRSESLLGDYLLDLSPGTDNAPLLQGGEEIRNVVDAQGMEKLMGSLQEITADVKTVTSALSQVLGGQKGERSMQQIVDNLVRLTEATDAVVRRSGEQLAQILENAQVVSQDVREVTHGQQESLQRIVSNLEAITQDARSTLGTVRRSVEGGEVQQSLEKLERTLANAEEITGKVKRGEGAAGKLISDPRLGESVEEVAEFADRLSRLRTEVSVKGEYLMGLKQAKSTVGVRLIPSPDKYYLLEVVDDPRGITETAVVQTAPPSRDDPPTQVQRRTREGLKLSAQLARQFGFATVRFGLIESTGGLGVDLAALDQLFTLKVDAFQFTSLDARWPRLRAALRVAPSEHLFATVGMDDMLNAPLRDPTGTQLLSHGREVFVGGGVFFTDEDLKALITVVRLPSP